MTIVNTNLWLIVYEARETKLDWEMVMNPSGYMVNRTMDRFNMVVTNKNGFSIMMNKAGEFKKALAGIKAFMADKIGYIMDVNEDAKKINILKA